MKKLTIEEKVKAYDEAIRKAKDMLNYKEVRQEDVEYLFPELKESEDKIRKELIDFVKSRLAGFPQCEKFIAWLEKQGEQKHADEVEPKFKVGDWCIDNEDGIVFQIVKVLDNTYTYKTNEGKEYSCTHYSLENDVRLWTIQDAKDGDVLASEDKDKVFLYNGKLDLRGRVCGYCGIYKSCDGLQFTKCAIGNYFTYKEPHPATKEQRDQLEKAMANAGYTFDFEKKELKKIETNLLTVQRAKEISPFMKSGFDSESAAWSEEDEKILSTIIKEGDLKPSERQWLKSLKPQKQWKPSKLQIEALESATANCAYSEYQDCLKELIKQLKQL